MKTIEMWKSFSNIPVNGDINIEFHKGKVAPILDPNEASSTTLLRQIYGELKPDEDAFSRGRL
ncbi:MAG: hypothetical protein ACP5L1_02620 [Caldivirga sp.]|uniref:hypothetical protein n=1 Tax=Caldivirga sp. TaxID=2080243 RepID=UPI003D0DD9D7